MTTLVRVEPARAVFKPEATAESKAEWNNSGKMEKHFPKELTSKCSTSVKLDGKFVPHGKLTTIEAKALADEGIQAAEADHAAEKDTAGEATPEHLEQENSGNIDADGQRILWMLYLEGTDVILSDSNTQENKESLPDFRKRYLYHFGHWEPTAYAVSSLRDRWLGEKQKAVHHRWPSNCYPSRERDKAAGPVTLSQLFPLRG